VAKRRKGNPDDAVARELKRLTFTGGGGAKLDEMQLSVMEDMLCINSKLPDTFRAFLLRQNGGRPSPSAFTWHHPSEGKQSASVDKILGLDARPPDDLSRDTDCIRMTLKLRDELPAWAIVIGNVNRDDWLLTFEDGPREGQVWLKYWDEVPATVDEPANPEAGVYRVAESFEAFLQLLEERDGGGDNADDDADDY
jgi:hypothetical protein